MEEIPSDESGEMRHSHLDLPLVAYPVVAVHLQNFTKELSNADWLDLANGVSGNHVFDLLSRMLLKLVHTSSLDFLNHLESNLLANRHQHFPSEGNSCIFYGPSELINCQPLLDGCSYCRVTESQVYSSLGDILDTCFGQILGTVQRQSSDSVRLCTLLSVAITKYLNPLLSYVTGSTSVQSDRPRSPIRVEEMVCHVMNILNDCLNAEHAPLSSESSEGDDAEIPGPRETACPLSQLPKCSVDETFLTMCLAKLINYTAEKTHTTTENMDFYQLVARVKERIVEDQSYTVPQSAQNLHITIYNKLCHKFRPKYVLWHVMEQGDPAFVEAFVEMLKAQLKKSTENTSKSKKMWRIFRRNSDVNSVCNDKATESHIEENEKKNLRQQNRRCSGFTRTCSSVFSAVRKAFTCGITKQYETEESLS